jgi:hypothetical protein
VRRRRTAARDLACRSAAKRLVDAGDRRRDHRPGTAVNLPGTTDLIKVDAV